MDESAIRQVARDVVAEMVGGPVVDTDSLIASGRIDSLSVLKLISKLEQRLSVDIPPANLQPDDFESVDWIVDTVSRVGRPR